MPPNLLAIPQGNQAQVALLAQAIPTTAQLASIAAAAEQPQCTQLTASSQLRSKSVTAAYSLHLLYGDCPVCSPALISIFTPSLATALGANAATASVTCLAVAPSPSSATATGRRRAALGAEEGLDTGHGGRREALEEGWGKQAARGQVAAHVGKGGDKGSGGGQSSAQRAKHRALQQQQQQQQQLCNLTLLAYFSLSPGADLAGFMVNVTTADVAAPTDNTAVARPSQLTQLQLSSQVLVVATNLAGASAACQFDQNLLVSDVASILAIPTPEVAILDQSVGAPVYVPPSPPAPSPGKSNKLSGGAVAGIVIGVIAGVALLVGLAMLLARFEILRRSNPTMAYSYNDPRMITWHNQLADIRQATAGGGFQHYITSANMAAGIPVQQNGGFSDISQIQMEVNDDTLAKNAATGQLYAQ